MNRRNRLPGLGITMALVFFMSILLAALVTVSLSQSSPSNTIQTTQHETRQYMKQK